MAEPWARLEKALSKHAPAVLESLCSGADEDEIVNYEDAMGFKLPADYRAFLMQHNGGEERPSLLGRFFFMPLDQQFAHRDEVIEQMTAEREGDDECPWNEHFIAFGNQHSFKNLLFLDGDSGKVWHYLEGDWTELAPSFTAYVTDLAEKLETGKLAPDDQGRLVPRK